MAVAPNLGNAHQFGVLGASAVTGSTGAGTVVNGDVGVAPGTAISNFPPSTVSPPFSLRSGNTPLEQAAQTDALAAYNFLAAQAVDLTLPAELGGTTQTPGVYDFTGGAANIAGGTTLTLDGPGVYIFKTASTVTANLLSNVSFINGASPCNVFWVVGSSATLNGVTFGGNVIAVASITADSSNLNLQGRLLALNGAVTMPGAGGNQVGGCSLSCPVITVSPTTLPDGIVGVLYSQVITASGGAAPYTFTVTAGSLPPGLALDPTTGVLSGTPTTAGPYNFTITATDMNGCLGSRNYTLLINGPGCLPIFFTPVSLPNGTVGKPYSQVISATGGSTPPYTFTVLPPDTLPPGLALTQPPVGPPSLSALLSGTPTAAGTYTFTIVATDSSDPACNGQITYTVIIGPKKRGGGGRGFNYPPTLCFPRVCYDEKRNIVPCYGNTKDMIPCPLEIRWPTPTGRIYELYSSEDLQCCYRLKPLPPR